MSSIYKKLNKGFDIPLQGAAKKELVEETIISDLVAVKPTDFMGFGRNKILAQPGTKVKAGSPLFASKSDLRIQATSPVSGEVVEIVRGEKRKTLAFVVKKDPEIEYEEFGVMSSSQIQNLSRQDAAERLLASGVWPQIIQRPYAVVANPQDTPKAIFISGFDSHPLAPDYNFLFQGDEQYFQEGINVLNKFTSGITHLNINANTEIPKVFSHVEGVQVNKFKGPHPAGCVGVQIHHLDPINKGDVVWTISPYGVIQIGKLFMEGRYDATKRVALVGSEVSEPKYYSTISGVQIGDLVNEKISGEHVRYISGNVLTGERVETDGFLGYYDSMVTVLPEGDQHEVLGWIRPQFNKISFQRAFGLLSFFDQKKPRKLTTNTNGEKRAFVQTGVFEKVTPMDIYPEFLFKAILTNDFDNMESLGILEVAEEDMALCEFVDVSKNPIQQIIRDGINLILEE